MSTTHGSKQAGFSVALALLAYQLVSPMDTATEADSLLSTGTKPGAQSYQNLDDCPIATVQMCSVRELAH